LFNLLTADVVLGCCWIFSGFWWSFDVNEANFRTYDKTHACYWSSGSGIPNFFISTVRYLQSMVYAM